MRSQIDAEVRSEPFGGRLAGHDDPPKPWQQAFFDAKQRSAVALSEARLQGGRVMDQANRIPSCERIIQADECGQREAVDDRPRVIG